MTDLYLGLDLSTQQLKGIVLDNDLSPVCHAKVEFDSDLPEYKTTKGVYTDSESKEVEAPVEMWLDAIDLLFNRLASEVDLSRVKAVSGACQQHASVYWNESVCGKLRQLGQSNSLKEGLANTLVKKTSPNWQDHSTAKECVRFEEAAGGREELAKITGSRAHHRFTGPQMLKLQNKDPDAFKETNHIKLVSSFLASVLSGQLAPLDISDVCGMNLWNVNKQEWDVRLLGLFDEPDQVKAKLGHVSLKGEPIGTVSSYFTRKFGLSCDCLVLPFTGDNPGTIMALPLTTNDVIISLGTSTTALVVTEKYVPSSLYHLFAHPVGKGYMGMLCYCNGALAREKIRDSINDKFGLAKGKWDKFDELVESGRVLGQETGIVDSAKIGFYFPLDEIIPDVESCTKRYIWQNGVPEVAQTAQSWTIPDDDALRIVESQALSIRVRLEPMLTSDRPRKVYFVGGASANEAICRAFCRVLVPSEGAFTQDFTDACALGAAHHAAHAILAEGQPWEEFLASKWRDGSKRLPNSAGIRDEYGKAAEELFVQSEKLLSSSS